MSCLYAPEAAFSNEQTISKKMNQSGETISDWMARWELARVLNYAKRYDESITEYKKLLQQKPDLYLAKAEMAGIILRQGKKSEAATILGEIPPENTDDNTKLVMADIYAANKDYKRAEPFYRSYLSKHPDDLKVRLKLAELLSWDKRYSDSIQEYQGILQKIPDDIQVRRKYAFVLSWAGRHSEAIAELRKTLK